MAATAVYAKLNQSEDHFTGYGYGLNAPVHRREEVTVNTLLREVNLAHLPAKTSDFATKLDTYLKKNPIQGRHLEYVLTWKVMEVEALVRGLNQEAPIKKVVQVMQRELLKIHNNDANVVNNQIQEHMKVHETDPLLAMKQGRCAPCRMCPFISHAK